MKRRPGVPKVLCHACPNLFRPTKATHRHCSADCRKRAFRRRQADAAASRPAAVALDAGQLRENLDRFRQLLGAPALLDSAQPEAFALVREAEQQLRRWQQRLVARKQRLDKLNGQGDDLSVRVQVLTDGRQPTQPATADTHCAIACTAPDLAIVVTGRRAPLL